MSPDCWPPVTSNVVLAFRAPAALAENCLHLINAVHRRVDGKAVQIGGEFRSPSLRHSHRLAAQRLAVPVNLDLEGGRLGCCGGRCGHSKRSRLPWPLAVSRPERFGVRISFPWRSGSAVSSSARKGSDSRTRTILPSDGTAVVSGTSKIVRRAPALAL